VAPDAVSVVPDPLQIAIEVGFTVTVGRGFTFTTDVAVLVQPA
jgi:hypothetical protein